MLLLLGDVAVNGERCWRTVACGGEERFIRCGNCGGTTARCVRRGTETAETVRRLGGKAGEAALST